MLHDANSFLHDSYANYSNLLKLALQNLNSTNHKNLLWVMVNYINFDGILTVIIVTIVLHYL